MRKSIILLAILSFMIGLCFSRVAKGENSTKAKKTHPVTVAIALFDDLRPKEERSGNARRENCNYGKPWDYTTDDFIKPRNSEITYNIFKYIKSSDIFVKVIYTITYKTSEIRKNGIPESLKKKADAVLIADIKHYYGYSSYEIKQAGGLLGYAINEAIKKPTKYSFKGHTELSMQLINTKDGNVLWEDVIDELMEGTDVLEKDPLPKETVAFKSLSGVEESLIRKLEELKITALE